MCVQWFAYISWWLLLPAKEPHHPLSKVKMRLLCIRGVLTPSIAPSEYYAILHLVLIWTRQIWMTSWSYCFFRVWIHHKYITKGQVWGSAGCRTWRKTQGWEEGAEAKLHKKNSGTRRRCRSKAGREALNEAAYMTTLVLFWSSNGELWLLYLRKFYISCTEGSYVVVPTKPESNFKAWWQLVLKAGISLPEVS